MNGMHNAARVAPADLLLTVAVQQVLQILREGYDYARDLGVSPWEFAVEVPALLASGGTANTLRWLSRRGYAEYADLRPRAPGRGNVERLALYRPHPVGPCFVLTERGAEAARAVCPPPRPQAVVPARPVWDGATGQLVYLGQLVKRFRKVGSHQRAVLDAFQQAGWPEQLDDPLPEDPGVSRKRRLQDTIKNLNRHHQRQLLRFFGSEGGGAIAWKGWPESTQSTPPFTQSTP